MMWRSVVLVGIDICGSRYLVDYRFGLMEVGMWLMILVFE